MMNSRRSWLGVLLLGLVVASVAIGFGGPFGDVQAPDASTSESPSNITTTTDTITIDANATDTNATTTTQLPDTVTFVDANGTELATIGVRVADTRQERRTGLSETESLPEDEGMLFVFPSEGEPTFVMRDMSFPLDMIFVGEDGRITEIYEAPVEDRPLTGYSATAKWVVEVNRGFTDEHDISVGDSVVINRSQ